MYEATRCDSDNLKVAHLRIRLLREVSLSLLAGSNHDTGGFTLKETLELRVRLHDLGAIYVLGVLGDIVSAHRASGFRGSLSKCRHGAREVQTVKY